MNLAVIHSNKSHEENLRLLAYFGMDSEELAEYILLFRQSDVDVKKTSAYRRYGGDVQTVGNFKKRKESTSFHRFV